MQPTYWSHPPKKRDNPINVNFGHRPHALDLCDPLHSTKESESATYLLKKSLETIPIGQLVGGIEQEELAGTCIVASLNRIYFDYLMSDNRLLGFNPILRLCEPGACTGLL